MVEVRTHGRRSPARQLRAYARPKLTGFAGRRFAAILAGLTVVAAVVVSFSFVTAGDSVADFDASFIEDARTGSQSNDAVILVTDSVLQPLDLRVLAEPPEVEPEDVETYDPGEVERLVNALIHDDVRRNAVEAYRRLQGHPEAKRRLERALHSYDRQQRQLAAMLIWPLGEAPTAPLIEVSVEGLHADGLPFDRETNSYSDGIDNAKSFFLRLRDYPSEARAALRRVIDSRDPQQRFLSAVLLACHGDAQYAWRATSVLLQHLEDNEIHGDGILAAHALYKFGAPARAFLERARHSADAQARTLLDRVLAGPDATTRRRQDDRLFFRKLENYDFVNFERRQYAAPPRRS